jgi:hypothetical protein
VLVFCFPLSKVNAIVWVEGACCQIEYASESAADENKLESQLIVFNGINFTKLFLLFTKNCLELLISLTC